MANSYVALRRAQIGGVKYERGDAVPDAPSLRNFQTLRAARYIGTVDDLPERLREPASAKLAEASSAQEAGDVPVRVVVYAIGADAFDWRTEAEDGTNLEGSGKEDGYQSEGAAKGAAAKRYPDLPVLTEAELEAQAIEDAEKREAAIAARRAVLEEDNVETLKQRCRELEVKTGGTKVDLINRVIEAEFPAQEAGDQGNGE
jgi:hypothetical protein